MEKYVKVKSKTDNYIYVNVATADAVGMVKPDNYTLNVSEDGTLKVRTSPHADYAGEATHAQNADDAMKATYYQTSSGTPSSKTINNEFLDIKKNIDDIENGTIAVEVAKYYEKIDGGKSEKTIGEHLKDHEDGIDALFATTADLTNNKQDQIKSSDNRNISITLIDELTSTADGKPDIPSVYGIKKYILDNLKLVNVSGADDIKYQLKIQDNVLGTIDFPKEILLKTVSYDPETNILILVFDTENGEITQNIDLNDLVDIYTAGNGLQISNNEFSVKKDSREENVVEVSSEGVYVDGSKYVPKIYLENLYFQRTNVLTANLVSGMPIPDSSAYMQLVTNATDIKFTSSNKLTISKILESDLKIAKTDALKVTLLFAINTTKDIEFGARVKIGTRYVSSNQSFGLDHYAGNSEYTSVNEKTLSIIFDNLLGVESFPEGATLSVEIFARQGTSGDAFTMRVFCGATIDVFYRNSFAALAFNQTSISTSQLADKAVTKPKLSQDLQDEIQQCVDGLTKSELVSGAFLNGQNTLKDAISNFKVESNNRFDYDNVTPVISNGTLSPITNGYLVQGNYNPDAQNPNAFVNGRLTFRMAVNPGEIISFDYKINAVVQTDNRLWVGFTSGRYAKTITPQLSIGSTGRASIVVPNEASNTLTEWIILLSSMTVEITNICISKVTDTYTPFLADGTAVTVRKANKNLASFNDSVDTNLTVSNSVFTLNGVPSASIIKAGNFIYLNKGTYNVSYHYISGSMTANPNNPNIGLLIRLWDKNNKSAGYFSILPNNYTTDYNQNMIVTESGFYRLYPLFNALTYSNLKFGFQIEKSDTYTGYETPVYEDITTAVGQSVNITQYDKVTNLSVLTEGGSVTGQFILSTADQINVKPTSLVGTFAQRPTGTYTYPIIYTATDKTDQTRTTRLEAREDGSVSSK